MKLILPTTIGDNLKLTKVTNPLIHSNSIFSRHSTSIADIKSIYRKLRHAKRDPKNILVMLVDEKRVEEWIATGEGANRIMYYQSKQLWMFVRNVST